MPTLLHYLGSCFKLVKPLRTGTIHQLHPKLEFSAQQVRLDLTTFVQQPLDGGPGDDGFLRPWRVPLKGITQRLATFERQ